MNIICGIAGDTPLDFSYDFDVYSFAHRRGDSFRSDHRPGGSALRSTSCLQAMVSEYLRGEPCWVQLDL